MSWMAWTWPTAAFFIGIGASLIVLTLWELRQPTVLRRGWLPMATTRGDRFFISLLAAAFLHLLWLGMVGHALWLASILAIGLGIALMRWG